MSAFFIRCIAMLAAMLCTVQVALASDIMVMNAVARASLTPTATAGALYFSIMNHGSTEDSLLSLSTSAAESATLHETQMDGDVMKMRELETPLVVPSGTTIDMQPGGTHVMLMGLKAPLKKGETLKLELVFKNAGVVQVEVPVGDVAAGQEHSE
jgi:periplasmic copper chaperone A